MRLFFDLGEPSTLALGKGKGGKKGKLAGKNFLALLQQNQQKGASALTTLANGKATTLGMFSEHGLGLPTGMEEKLKTLKLKAVSGEIALPKAKAPLSVGDDQNLKLSKGERGWMVHTSKGKSATEQATEQAGEDGDLDALLAKKLSADKGSAKGKQIGEDKDAKDQVQKEPLKADAGEEHAAKTKAQPATAAEPFLAVAQAVSGKIPAEHSKSGKGIASQGLAQQTSDGIVESNGGQSATGLVLSPEEIARERRTIRYDLSWRWTRGGRNTGQPIPEGTFNETLVAQAKSLKAKKAATRFQEGEATNVNGADPQLDSKSTKLKTTKGIPAQAPDWVVQDIVSKGQGNAAGSKTKVGQQSQQENGDVYKVRQHLPRRGKGEPVTHTPPIAAPQTAKDQLSEQQIAQLLKDLPKTGKFSQAQALGSAFSAKQAKPDGDVNEMFAHLSGKIPKMPSSKMASWIAAHRESIQAHQVEITDVQRGVVFDKAKPHLAELKGQPILKQPTLKAELQMDPETKGFAVDAKSKQTPVEAAIKAATTDTKESVKTSVAAAANLEASDKKAKQKAMAAQVTSKQQAAKATQTPQALQATAEQAPTMKTQPQAAAPFASVVQAAEAPEHVTKLGVEERSLTSAMDKAEAKANLGSLRATQFETAQATVTPGAVHQSTMNADIPRDSQGLPQPMFRDLEEQLAKAVRIRPNSVSVKLNPETLGEVRIRVIRRGEQLQAKIQAENPQTADLISDHQSKLQERLREQGIEISEFEVYSDGAMDQGLKDHQSGWERQAEYAMRSDIVSGDPWGRVSESHSEREAVLHDADALEMPATEDEAFGTKDVEVSV